MVNLQMAPGRAGATAAGALPFRARGPKCHLIRPRNEISTWRASYKMTCKSYANTKYTYTLIEAYNLKKYINDKMKTFMT